MDRLRLTFDETFCTGEEVRSLGNRLYAARTLIPQGFEEIFRRRALYANAHSTTAIEGNPLSDAERCASPSRAPTPSSRPRSRSPTSRPPTRSSIRSAPTRRSRSTRG